MKIKVIIVGGARPNFMKIAPIIRELSKNKDKFDFRLLHTGQHYDYKMSEVFFEQFELPKPDYFLNVGSGSHAYQTAQIMMEFEKVALEFKPDLLIIVGDVNSTIATALVAAKLGIKIAHVEAGLRSFDMQMPEEINRILTDRITDIFLCSEPDGIENLIREGTESDKINLVGNTMIDTLLYSMPKIDEAATYSKFGLQAGNYAVATAHRPSNVDTPENLTSLLEIFEFISEQMKLVLPIHPRTKKNLEQFGLFDRLSGNKNISIHEPLGYFEFINLVKNSKMILTDSGGIQEETTMLGVPCITLRENTERPYTITNGTNIITGLDKKAVKDAISAAMKFDKNSYKAPSIWDGNAAKNIIKVLINNFGLE